MKKRLLFTLLILLVPIINVNAATDDEKRQALLETAKAYYSRGNTIQYDTERSHYFNPEDATSQNRKYNVCSSFVSATYKNALDMDIPNSTCNLVDAVANGTFDSTEIVKYYSDTDLNDLATSNSNWSQAQYFNYIIGNNLQIGDIVVYYINRPDGCSSGSGHVVIISSNYTRTTLNNEEIYDYEVYESQGSGDGEPVDYGKSGLGLDYNDIDGSVKHNYLSKTALINQLTHSKLTDTSKREIAVIRPKKTNYDTTNSAKVRIKYPGIKISKTLANPDLKMNQIEQSQSALIPLIDQSLINNGIVSIGNIIYYRITITNTSSSNYNISADDPLIVTETVSPYVSVLSARPVGVSTTIGGTAKNGVIIWNITDPLLLEPGETITIGYSAKVINDYDLIDEEIIATGTVGGTRNANGEIVGSMPNTTITNYIGKNYNSTAANKLITAYNNKKNSSTNSGLDFIKEIYDTADVYTSIDLSNIEAKYASNAIDIGEKNSTKTIVHNLIGSINAGYIRLGTSSMVSNILTKYYGGIRTTSPAPKAFNNDANRRMDTIYKDHFETGDILIYINTDETLTKESGLYAFVYLDDGSSLKGFYGKNKLNDNTNENYFPLDPNNANYPNNTYNIGAKTIHNNDLINNVLFAKDVFVILRPTLVPKTINIFETSDNLTITKKNKKMYVLFKPITTNTVADIKALVSTTNGPYSKRVTNSANTEDTENLIIRNNNDNIRTTDRLRIELEEGDIPASGSSSELEYIIALLGDTDPNGIINRNDATEIATRIIDKNMSGLNYEIQLAADYNMDSTYKMNDVMKLIDDNNINLSNN